MGLKDIHSGPHTKWNCKYRIVFAPKYRRQVFYKEKREAAGKILRELCEWKGVPIFWFCKKVLSKTANNKKQEKTGSKIGIVFRN